MFTLDSGRGVGGFPVPVDLEVRGLPWSPARQRWDRSGGREACKEAEGQGGVGVVGLRQNWGLEGQEEGRTISGDSLSMGALGLALNWGQLCLPGDTW